MPNTDSSDERDLTCWVMTTGEPGMRSQAAGLAERIGQPGADLAITEKIITLKSPWRWLPGHLAPFALKGVSGDPLSPPWPDLLITCGRRSVAPSIAIRAASAGRIFTVHIQDPGVPPSYFDMVVTPQHDELSGANVYETFGAVHKVTREKLNEACESFREKFVALARPLVAVLIGGTSKSYSLTTTNAHDIATALRGLAEGGAGLIVTCSARTGAENEAVIRGALDGTGAFMWDGSGDNPYLGMLGLADYVLVTVDSASMITEATATGKPVLLLPLDGGSRKFSTFHEQMRAGGYIRSFNGTLEDWSYKPLDETGRIAKLVRQKLRECVTRQ